MSRIASFFKFSSIPPLLSHFLVFVATVSIVFDVLHLTVLPIKIPNGRILLPVAPEKLDGVDTQLGQDLIAIKLEEGLLCAVEGLTATLVQIQDQPILSVPITHFEGGITFQELEWRKPSSIDQACKSSWSIDYG